MDKCCEWCGNNSGLMDKRGQCISCGGSLSTSPKSVLEMWEGGNWAGHSGSPCVLFGEAGRKTFQFSQMVKL